MGIAKNIEAYGIFEGYTSDTDIFIQKLSDLLDSDFVVSVTNADGDLVTEHQLFKFGKPLSHQLFIDYDEYTFDDKGELLPCYRLIVPINYIYIKYIEIEFFPNKTCYITFLTFEHLWVTFIESLRWGLPSYADLRESAVLSYNQLRNEYGKVLKKLGMDKIFIVTDAYYNIDGITNNEKFPEMSFEKLMDLAKELDNFLIFDLNTILQINNPEQLPKDFMNENILKIAFIDNL
jgi:hypothetical protein